VKPTWKWPMADDGSINTKAIIAKSSKEYKDTFTQRTYVEQAFSSIKEHDDIEMPM
jgi:hypothetical protein